jgi:hypothetical protein
MACFRLDIHAVTPLLNNISSNVISPASKKKSVLPDATPIISFVNRKCNISKNASNSQNV